MLISYQVDNQTIGKDVWFDNVQVLHYNTQVLEENHYYPYGLTVSASAMGMTPQPLKYNGKELETSFDLQAYEYGARQYNSQIGRWNGIDPLADKYYAISPFAYVANNPINAIDPDGKKIVFVNGYLGFGSPNGGAKYWNGESGNFVTSAKRTLNDYQNPYFTDVEYSMTSSVDERKSAGYQYAHDNFLKLTEDMNAGDAFEFVTHSMGAAFGEGMISYLKERGYKVKVTLHINPFQAHDIKANKYKNPNLPWAGQEKTDLIVDYQNMNDPVINNVVRSSPGGITNADATYRVFSTQDLTKIHRDPIDKGAKEFWEAIMIEVNKILNSSDK